MGTQSDIQSIKVVGVSLGEGEVGRQQLQQTNKSWPPGSVHGQTATYTESLWVTSVSSCSSERRRQKSCKSTKKERERERKEGEKRGREKRERKEGDS